MHYAKNSVFNLHGVISTDLFRAPPKLLSTSESKQILYKRVNKAFDIFLALILVLHA